MYTYPYFDKPNIKGDTCQTVETDIAMYIDHYVRLKVDKEEDLLYLLAYYGPVVTSKFLMYFSFCNWFKYQWFLDLKIPIYSIMDE